MHQPSVTGIGRTLGRTTAIAANVFHEVIRDQALYLIGFYALFLVIAHRLLPEIAAATEKKIIFDVGLAMIAILGLIIAIFVGAGLVNKEIDQRTVFVLIAKPVSRVEFLLGKHWGLSAVLAILIAAMTAILIILLHLTRVPYTLSSILFFAAFLFLQLSLIAAVAIGFGVFTSSLLASFLTLAVYFMGQMSRDIVSLGKLTQNPQIEQLTQNLYLILPDLARFDLKDQTPYNLIPSPDILLNNAGYGLLYIILVLAIAALIFSIREF
jgi:ABC-type transport system involved in multi-copper enzyme maturation permease subunit